jgi:putative transposase
MAGLCREFGVSRKTGYKILVRYNEIGLEGPTDRSRRPYRHANQLPFQIETQIVRLKQDKRSWGAPKIRERLARLYPDVHAPAISTIHAVLDRHGLVKRRTGRRNRAKGTPLCLARQPNDVWCADYKGEFMLADRRYCYQFAVLQSVVRFHPCVASGALRRTSPGESTTTRQQFPLSPRADRGRQDESRFPSKRQAAGWRRHINCEDFRGHG